MAINKTYAITQVTWNANTWDKDTGGTIGASIQSGGEPLEDWVAADEWPTFLAVVNKRLRVRLTMREPKWTEEPGNASAANMVITLKTKSGTVTITLATMILIEINPDQGRASMGETVLVFGHESADGTTNPIT